MKLNLTKIEIKLSESLNRAVWVFYQNRKYKVQDVATSNILLEFDTKEKFEEYLLRVDVLC